MFIVELRGDALEFFGPYATEEEARTAQSAWKEELIAQGYHHPGSVRVHRLHPPKPPGE
jgi:hypothetical protein